MKFKKEKYLIFSDVIILAFLTLLPMLSGLLDVKIKTHEDKISQAERWRSDYIQLKTFHTSRYQNYQNLHIVLSQINPFLNKKDIVENDITHPVEKNSEEAQEIIAKYKNGKIDVCKYAEEMAMLNNKYAQNYDAEDSRLKEIIDDLRKHPPKIIGLNVRCIKNFLLGTQMIAGVIAIIILFVVFANIKINNKSALKKDNDKYLKHDLMGRYYALHEKAIDFAVTVNAKSYEKYSPPLAASEKYRVSRGCLHRIGERAVIIHRSILSLCETGWMSMSPILLRSLLECLTNTLAIITPTYNCDYMGFKFCTLDFLNIMVETKDKKLFEYHNTLIQTEMKKMDDETKKMADKYIKEFLKQKQEKTWWFKPEYKNTEDILSQWSSGKDWYNSFKVLSKSTHSAYVGLGLFKDKSDHVDINPRADFQSAKEAIVLSSRLLTEICHLRDTFEKLDCDSKCNELIEEIVALKDDVEAPKRNRVL